MTKEEIIRAWKDTSYRSSLTDSERSGLPENPAGIMELSDEDLDNASGGTTVPLTIGATTYAATAILSCFPSCSNSMWKGTCAAASVGCCREEE